MRLFDALFYVLIMCGSFMVANLIVWFSQMVGLPLVYPLTVVLFAFVINLFDVEDP
jgi:hypothetical protein